MRFRVHSGRWAVSKLGPDAAVPDWAWTAGFASLTRTPSELSIVCAENAVPEEVQSEKGWVRLELEGPIPFNLTGVLHAFLEPLAQAGVPVFALSTFNTDWVLVPESRLEDALSALRRMMDARTE
ncbi:MAG: ACT domain-containing protein [Bryobacteraceae bacterium]|nr:ACT domain-containing protein [Bryobacteraceae bacterium]